MPGTVQNHGFRKPRQALGLQPLLGNLAVGDMARLRPLRRKHPAFIRSSALCASSAAFIRSVRGTYRFDFRLLPRGLKISPAPSECSPSACGKISRRPQSAIQHDQQDRAKRLPAHRESCPLGVSRSPAVTVRSFCSIQGSMSCSRPCSSTSLMTGVAVIKSHSLRLLQHAPKRAQSVVRVCWRTADLDGQHIVSSYLVEPHRDQLGRFEQSPAYPVVLSGWRLWGSILGRAVNQARKRSENSASVGTRVDPGSFPSSITRASIIAFDLLGRALVGGLARTPIASAVVHEGEMPDGFHV